MAISDCIVVGAGIIGLTTALELQRSGMQVTLLDSGEVGRESSWAGGGILFPLYPWRYPERLYPMIGRGIQTFPAYLADLHLATGIDPEYQDCGMLLLDEDEFESSRDWTAAVLKARVETLGAASLAGFTLMEAGISASVGQFLPPAAQVRNPRLLQALVRAFCQIGGQLLQHCPLLGVEFSAAGAVQAIMTSEGRIHTERLVLATGAWSGARFGDLDLSQLPVRPVRGQMLLYRIQAQALRSMILRQGRYLIPRRDGHLLVGSTVEEVGFDPQTTRAATLELQQFACSLLPALGQYRVLRQWAGLRPGSPDGIPIIGAHPQHSGLYLNCGHFRNGVLFSLPSAELLRDLLLGVTPQLDASVFSPMRYLQHERE